MIDIQIFTRIAAFEGSEKTGNMFALEVN